MHSAAALPSSGSLNLVLFTRNLHTEDIGQRVYLVSSLRFSRYCFHSCAAPGPLRARSIDDLLCGQRCERMFTSRCPEFLKDLC